MITNLVLLVVGFGLLVKGADLFIEAAARLAKIIGISDFVIGLTLTAIGTSIPELASSLSATLNNSSGLVIGNVVGSNIANIGLIIGLSAILVSFKVPKKIYERDGFIMILAAILFFFFVQDNVFSRIEAVVILGVYVLYVLFLIKSDSENTKKHKFSNFMEYVFNFEYIAPRKNHAAKNHEKQKLLKVELLKDISLIIVSGLAIIFGSKFLVEQSIWLATLLGLPQSVIGLSIIAIGTSLPELTVSISAAKKGKGGLIVGNIIGSNIANIALIIGTTSLIRPLEISEMSVVYTTPIMLFFSLGFLYLVQRSWTFDRRKGVIMLGCYLLFMLMAFIGGLN